MKVRNWKRAAVVAGMAGAALIATASPAMAGPWIKEGGYSTLARCQQAGRTAVHYANETYYEYMCYDGNPGHFELWLHMR